MARQKKKPKRVWLSCDKKVRHVEVSIFSFKKTYQLWRCKPKLDPAKGVFKTERDDGCLRTFCSKEFESITGFHLEPGECVRVRIIVEKV